MTHHEEQIPGPLNRSAVIMTQDRIGSSVVRVRTERWDMQVRILRDAAGEVRGGEVLAVTDRPSPETKRILTEMGRAMMRDTQSEAQEARRAEESETGLRAEMRRWRESLLRAERRRQFWHVMHTLRERGPVSLPVLHVRSAACFGATVGQDGVPGTGEVVGSACPRMVWRGGRPRCGACGCPSTPLSDLREVLRSPGWGCGPEKENRFAAMTPAETVAVGAAS